MELGGSGQQSGGWRNRRCFTLVYFTRDGCAISFAVILLSIIRVL